MVIVIYWRFDDLELVLKFLYNLNGSVVWNSARFGHFKFMICYNYINQKLNSFFVPLSINLLGSCTLFHPSLLRRPVVRLFVITLGVTGSD